MTPGRIVFLFALWMATSLAGPSRGDGPRGDASQQELDLASCIGEALKNDPDLQAATADLTLARARLAEAKAGRWGNAEYTQIFSAVPAARGDILDPPSENRNAILTDLGPLTRLDLSLNIPLWTFGRLGSALEAAQHGLEAQKAGGEARRAQTILNVKRLYYGVLLTEQVGLVLHEMLDNMDKAIAKTQERLDSNTSGVTEIDLLKLKTGRARLAKGVAEVVASSALSRSALARVVGLPLLTPMKLRDHRLQPVEVSIAPLEQYLSEGPERRPESEQLRMGLAAMNAKVEMERAAMLPTLFLLSGFQFGWAPNRTRQRNPFAAEDFNYTRPVAGLGLHWNLDFFRNQAKLQAAQAELDRLEAEQKGAASGLQLEIRKAYGEVVQGRDTMKAADDGRKAGRSLLVLTVSNFDIGIGEAEELFKALGAYTEVSTDYLRAVHDYNLAVATLSRTIGNELTSLQY